MLEFPDTGRKFPIMACRVFPFEAASGPANMARDEAMLELVVAEPSAAAFRAYSWTEPTLSLGYFQSYSEARSDPRWHDVPIVRRATGGGAIWHDHELTYALAIPGSHPCAAHALDLYRVVHSLLARLLGGRKADPKVTNGDGDEGRPIRPFLCFEDRSSEDVVIGDFKIVGSSQRRRKGAVLQHGSILFENATKTPELRGVVDLRTKFSWRQPEAFARILPKLLLPELGLVCVPTPILSTLHERALAIEREVYLNETWTQRH